MRENQRSPDGGSPTFEVLGRLAIGGQEVRGRLERRLVGALLVLRRERLSRDRLVDAVWGESPPPGAAASLQSRLSRLRLLVGAAFVRWDGSTYTVTIPPGHLDAEVFEVAALAATTGSQGAGSLDRFEHAVSLWRGPPFCELADEEFAQAETARLQSLRETVEAGRLRALRREGRHDEALRTSERLAHEFPLWDEIRIHRARALAAVGRSADALVELRGHRDRLRREMSLEAGPELAAVEEEIMRPPPSPTSSTARPPSPSSRVRIPDGLVGADAKRVGPTGRIWRGTLTPLRTTVGRDRQALQTDELLVAARRGTPGVVVITAAAGFGKTHFLGTIAERARYRGLRPVMVACVEEGTVPFAAIDELLRELGADQPIPTPVGRAAPRQVLDHARLQYEHHAQASLRARSLIAAAVASPTAVLVDNIDRADDGSALTLHLAASLAARQGSAMPLALVVTRRPVAGSLEGPAAIHVERLAQERITSHVSFGSLGVIELAALVEASTGVSPSSDLVHVFHEQLGGQPLAVIAALRSLGADALLVVRHGQLHLAPGAEAAGMTTNGVVLRTVELDDHGDASVLASLSLLRPGVTTHDAARLLGLEHASMLAVVERADALGLASVRGGAIRFEHSSLRAAFREQLTPTARQRLHLEVAARMAQPTNDSELLSLAWHDRQAGMPASASTRRIYLEAADRYFVSCDWTEASRYFRLAAEAGDLATRTVIRAGLAAWRSHDHLVAGTFFDRAAIQAATEGDDHLLTQALVARERASLTGSDDRSPAPRDLAVLADRLDDDHRDDEAQLCGLLAEMAYARNELDDADRWVERARRAAARGNDPARLAEVEFASALSSLGSLSLRQAAEGFRRAEITAGVENPWVRSWAIGRIALAEMMSGRWDRAAVTVGAALELSEPTSAWADQALALSVSATLHAVGGRLGEAAATAAEAELVWRRSGYPFVAPMLFPLLAELALHRDDIDAAMVTFDRWEATGLRGHRLWRLAALARLGLATEIRTHLGGQPINVPRPDALTMGNAALVGIGALVATVLEDRELAAASRDGLERLAERGVALIPGCSMTVDVLLARAAAAAS